MTEAVTGTDRRGAGMSRSEEDDSDDSGVIKDVTKKRSEVNLSSVEETDNTQKQKSFSEDKSPTHSTSSDSGEIKARRYLKEIAKEIIAKSNRTLLNI